MNSFSVTTKYGSVLFVLLYMSHQTNLFFIQFIGTSMAKARLDKPMLLALLRWQKSVAINLLGTLGHPSVHSCSYCPLKLLSEL